MTVKQAFYEVCEKPVEVDRSGGGYVSLYVGVPYYGGPEEGGWWGHDTSCLAYQWVEGEKEADAAVERVRRLAEELGQQAKTEFGDYCLKQTEWLEARGLDDDFLPEVNGEETYFVTREQQPRSLESTGSRHYE